MSDLVKKLISDPNITEAPTKISLNAPEIDKVTLILREGSYFSKDQKIAKYTYKQDSSNSSDSNGGLRKPIPISAPFYGRLLKYDKEEKELILEKCKHDSFYFNLCTKCNYDKSKDKDTNNDNYQKYTSLHPFLTFSLDKAKKEEMNIVKKYLVSKKLILLLDLDNTILHTCPFSLTKEEYTSLREQYKEYLVLLGIRREFDPMQFDKIIVKFRPYLKDFLSMLSNKYEIYTYTHGTKEYATGIIQYVNQEMVKETLSVDRLIARENGIIESKTIKKVFPTTENMVIILDDRADVWKENDDNLINCFHYTFFNEDINTNNQIKYPVKECDNALYSIMNVLNYVHKEFYRYYDEKKEIRSVKEIIKEKMHSIFNGMSFVCSGIFNKNEDFTNTLINFKIQKMGGMLYKELEDKENIDCLLIPEYKKTKKVCFFEKNNKTILYASYIDYCYKLFVKLNYEDFIMSDKRQRIEYIDENDIMNKNKETIDTFYSSPPVQNKNEEEKKE